MKRNDKILYYRGLN
ncbi:TPA: hypothetical protein OE587_000523 [Escherichia coli]|nr:hypothetical protein [Escherichia coli]MDF4181896.1 hypothetical protein [Escherichia coli]MDO2827427.1 hypothetical protein [Escherichia coli]HBE5662643.1 hypothetical protein [Escherichia coli]HBV0247927.1 hypothetical protein [Escherichia coli]HCN1379595.1 hypothetical protein [Escherichia coli]